MGELWKGSTTGLSARGRGLQVNSVCAEITRGGPTLEVEVTALGDVGEGREEKSLQRKREGYTLAELR